MNIKKFISLVFSVFFLGIFAVPVARALECDSDADGYIVISEKVMKEIDKTAKGVSYKSDGNYTAAEWRYYFEKYKTAQLTADEICDGLNFKAGAEPPRCDVSVIDPKSGVYDPTRVTSALAGDKLYPGALDTVGNYIDEDCDGRDKVLIKDTGKDLGGLVDKSVSLLSKLVVVVSVLVLIWGGILYATAAGDEGKTGKARKAIIGAIIGLLVGLLAPAIVEWVAANLV